MTYLVLVRHGETVWHAENRYAGISDIALTTRGLEQAAQLAAWARTARLSAVWASTLSRAQLTAAACAEVAGTPMAASEPTTFDAFKQVQARSLRREVLGLFSARISLPSQALPLM